MRLRTKKVSGADELQMSIHKYTNTPFYTAISWEILRQFLGEFVRNLQRDCQVVRRISLNDIREDVK